MNKEISATLSVFRSSPNKDDLEVHSTLVTMGIDRRIAARLVEFLPIAYFRQMMATSDLSFTNEYVRKLYGDTVSSKRLLTAEPMWNQSLEFAREEIAGGISKDALLTVAVRSPEFDLVNQLLKKGTKMKDIRFTALLLGWSEEGPDAASQT
jgi:hypothetical protein